MSFACRSATNSLATNDNLKRWGKKSNSKCDLCSSTGTLLHTLNGCKVLLNSGAYLWRHDNILHYLAKILSENKKDNVDFYVDIPNYQINGSTLPPNVVVTNLRPDVVFIDKNTTPPTCAIYELTIPFETNLTAANTRKRDKYQSLKTDIQANGFKCHLVPWECGSRGFIPRRVKLLLCQMLKFYSTVKTPSSYISNFSKICVLSSFSIFNARKEKNWSNPPVLNP